MSDFAFPEKPGWMSVKQWAWTDRPHIHRCGVYWCLKWDNRWDGNPEFQKARDFVERKNWEIHLERGKRTPKITA